MAFRWQDNSSSVATQVRKCLDGFQHACERMSGAEPHIKRKLPSGVISDELGRFRLWSGNVGAHRRGKSSLDYKLREASHIRDRVIELLQNLESVLQEMIDIITGVRLSWEDLSDSESDASDERDECAKDSNTTELEQLLSNIAEINTCLMRLSMAIRNPAPHDQFKQSTHIDVAHFEIFDIDHVRGKYPMAKEYLVDRLGKAISRRRQYLRYRDEHRKKLEQGLQPNLQVHEITELLAISKSEAAPSEKIQSTVASSLPLAVKASTSVTELDDRDYYEDAPSETSYASSAPDSIKLRPPQLPEQGQNGDPFECPLCFRFTSVLQTAAWHKHVYRDLQPYVCTFEGCEVPDRTYESRHEWFHHEIQAHRKYWECVDGCNQSFRSSESLRAHFEQEHASLANEGRVDDLVRNCERHDDMGTEADCPLCMHHLPSLAQLRRHLGKHHEELSLFALPLHMKENSEDSDVEEKDNDSHSVHSLAEDGKSLSSSSSNSSEVLEDAIAKIDEEKLQIRLQPSSVDSSTSNVLRCYAAECEIEFDGNHRHKNLARHLRLAHQCSAIYFCDVSNCNRFFLNEDDRIEHCSNDHPKATLPPDNNDEHGPNKRRRSSAEMINSSDTDARFACPFYKHDPERYGKRRTCPGPGWPTVHRMKEHLYRSHSQPIFCPRCYSIFDSDEEQLNHYRLQQCQLAEPQQIEGIDRATVLKLRKRTPALRSEEDKWRDVYQLIFPDVLDADIPSPFYVRLDKQNITASSQSIQAPPQNDEDYFEQLALFSRERGLIIHVNRSIVVDHGVVSLRLVREVVEAHGGFDSLKRNQGWAELGHELGFGKNLSPLGAEELERIYSSWIVPFDDHLKQDFARLEAASSDKNSSAHLKDEGTEDATNDSQKQPGAPSSANQGPHVPKPSLKVFGSLSVSQKSPRFTLPAFGEFHMLEEGIIFSHDAMGKKFVIPFEDIVTYKGLTPNDIRIDGKLYESLGSSMELLQDFDHFELEFADSFYQKTALDHILAQLPDKHAFENKEQSSQTSTTGKTTLLNSNSKQGESVGPSLVTSNDRFPSAIDDVLVEDLIGRISFRAQIVFRRPSIILRDMSSGNIWNFSGKDITALKLVNNSIDVTIASISGHALRNLRTGATNLLLSPENLAEVEILRGILELYARDNEDHGEEENADTLKQTLSASEVEHLTAIAESVGKTTKATVPDLDKPLPPCPRSVPSTQYNDWLTLPGYQNFDICPSCFDGVFAETPFATHFSSRSRNTQGENRVCDFSSPWMRLAWLLTIKNRSPSLDLLYALVNIVDDDRPCPGDQELNSDRIAWYTISDQEDSIPNFAVCPCDKRMTVALFPTIRPYFTKLVTSERLRCSLRTSSRRFPKYLDLLVELHAEAQSSGQQSTIERFIQLGRHYSQQDECRRDRASERKPWYYIPALPEFTVCEECYEELILPAQSKPIPQLFNKTAQIIPNEDPDVGTSCCLYSPRMRRVWNTSLVENDFPYLKLQAVERKSVETRLSKERKNIIDLMNGLERGSVQWETAKNELTNIETEWASWA